MEDLNEKLSSLLNSPEGMEKLRAAATALLGSTEANKSEPGLPNLAALLSNNAAENNTAQVEENPLESMASVGNILKVMQAVKGLKNDSRVELIRALKPYLSAARAKRAEQAIGFLKIAAVLPLLKQEGLLNRFLEG